MEQSSTVPRVVVQIARDVLIGDGYVGITCVHRGKPCARDAVESGDSSADNGVRQCIAVLIKTAHRGGVLVKVIVEILDFRCGTHGHGKADDTHTAVRRNVSDDVPHWDVRRVLHTERGDVGVIIHHERGHRRLIPHRKVRHGTGKNKRLQNTAVRQ